MEGADPIREPEELEMWYERGLRIIGPAWDNTRYAAGAWNGGGGLTPDGHRLLEVMAEFDFVLDLTHMSEQGTLEALDRYPGPIVATHSNSRALVPSQRQLSDLQIMRVAERGGIVGVVPFNIFLLANHRRGEPKERVTLEHVVAHIDHICQVVGDAQHVGLGSDFDGGFGSADIPAEMDSAADLPLIGKALAAHGYETADITDILGGNWLRFLRQVWSK
jgi:membrane dipeptidase